MGVVPLAKPQLGDSTATFEYNTYVHSFTPAALSGVVFLTSESMVAEDSGANFGSEMSALAICLKSRFALWSEGTDVPLIYTVPSKSLAPKLTAPNSIDGASTAVVIDDWADLGGVFEAVQN